MPKVRLHHLANKDLEELTPERRKLIASKIKSLAEHPASPDSKKIAGKHKKKYCRVRSGDWRIIYYVEDDVLHVPRVGRRDEVYKWLKRQ